MRVVVVEGARDHARSGEARSYQLPLSLEAIWADLRVAKLLEDLTVSRRGGGGAGTGVGC